MVVRLTNEDAEVVELINDKMVLVDVRGVRVELAAVIAEALTGLGPRLLPADAAGGLSAFREFLRNKALSDLVLYFVALRGTFADAHAFYRHVTAEPQRRRFMEMV